MFREILQRSQENTSARVSKPETLLKWRLWHRCFPILQKFLRTHFLTEHLRWLLLFFAWIFDNKTFYLSRCWRAGVINCSSNVQLLGRFTKAILYKIRLKKISKNFLRKCLAVHTVVETIEKDGRCLQI